MSPTAPSNPSSIRFGRGFFVPIFYSLACGKVCVVCLAAFSIPAPKQTQSGCPTYT